ncbi:MAG: hypothetical protein GQ532_08850 [Methylomarinum sp.]|nr:hypothetical protein [Methylomarinum sp.]
MGWKTEAGYDVLMQDSSNSCGMACCAMIMKHVDGCIPDEQMMASESKRIGVGQYEEKFGEKVGHVACFGPGSASSITPVDQSKVLGTYVNNLGGILTNYLIENETDFHDNPSSVFGKYPGQDVIALLNWDNGGGGHFVVVRKLSSNHIIVLDPAYGVSGQALSNNYTPNNSRAGGATGKFNGWVVNPTGKRLKAKRVKVMF